MGQAIRKRLISVPKGILYEGFAGTRAGMYYGFGGNAKIMSRSYHKAVTDIRFLKIGEANTYFNENDGTENTPSTTTTITSAVEYNGGFAQFIYGAAGPTGTVAPGAYVESSYIRLPTMIPKGATYFIRRYLQSSGSTCVGYAKNPDTTNGDLCNLNASTDQTMSGTITGGSFWSPPACMITQTDGPSTVNIGDSIDYGPLDESGNTPKDFRRGLVCHGFTADTFAFLNHANSTVKASTFIAASPARKQMWKYASHCVDGLGRNDITLGGDTAATLEGNLRIVRMQFNPRTKWIRCTLTPDTTSTGNVWLVDADQQVRSEEAKRLTFNTDVRNGLAGYISFFETGFACESVSQGGFWLGDGVTVKKYTPDGIHPSAAGYIQAAPAVSSHMDQIFYP